MGRGHALNNFDTRMNNFDTKIDGAKADISRVESKLESQIKSNHVDLLMNIQQSSIRTMKDLDGNKEPLRQYLRWHDDCLK